MRALRWHARGDVRLEELEDLLEPRPGNVVIAVQYCGICGSDLHEFAAGPAMIRTSPHPLTGAVPPITLGHEFSGDVVSVGAGVDESWVGTLVSVDSSLHCGTCPACRAGDYHVCASGGAVGLAADGAFADLVEIPATQLFRVPEGVPARLAALAEPLAVGLHAARRGDVAPGDRVLVTGAGFIGMAAILGALACGAAEVYVSEPDPQRRQLAMHIGATATFDPSTDDVRREVFSATGRVGPDVAIDATGIPQVLNMAIRSVRRRGRIVIAGLGELPLECSVRDLVLYERSVLGSLGSRLEIPRVLGLMASRRWDLSALITGVYSLDDSQAVFSDLARGPSGGLKVLLTPR